MENERKVSKLAWIPFGIMFILSLLLLIGSFIDLSQYNIPVKINFSDNFKIGMLGVLLAISLILPFWLYSIKKPAEKKYNYPLGLPKGSIRALILLVSAGAYIVLTLKGNALEDARNIFILIAVLYFFSRIVEKKEE